MNNTTFDDQPSIRSHCLGIMITVLCLPGLIANILVCYVVIVKGLLTSNNSSMYKLSFSMILADTVHLALLGFYLGPSSFAQDWLFPDNWTRRIPGTILGVVWYNVLIDLCLLSFNRYMAVCRPGSYQAAFSGRNTKIMIAFSWLGGLLLCAICEFVLCCRTYLYYGVYSYAYLDQTHINYNLIIILIPCNTFTSLMIIIMYGLVIYNIRIMNTRVADKIAVESQQRRRVKEIRYSFQLIIISGVFVVGWVLFNILGNVIPPTAAGSGYFVVIVILEIINSSANSFVCVIFNKEVNGPLKKKFCFCRQKTDAGVCIAVVQASASGKQV